MHEIDAIFKEIEQLKEKIPMAKEAIQFFKSVANLEDQLENHLASNGIQFAEKSQLFNRIGLHQFYNNDLNPASHLINQTIEWKLPKYKNVIQDFKTYEDTIALSARETENLSKQKAFYNHLLKLASQLEQRK